MKFILPKILGATVIAGIATLLMSAIFKVLILASVVAVVTSLISRKMNRRKLMQYGYGGQPHGLGQQRYAQEEPMQFNADYKMPFGNVQRRSGIIPIN